MRMQTKPKGFTQLLVLFVSDKVENGRFFEYVLGINGNGLEAMERVWRNCQVMQGATDEDVRREIEKFFQTVCGELAELATKRLVREFSETEEGANGRPD